MRAAPPRRQVPIFLVHDTSLERDIACLLKATQLPPLKEALPHLNSEYPRRHRTSTMGESDPGSTRLACAATVTGGSGRVRNGQPTAHAGKFLAGPFCEDEHTRTG